MVLLDGSWRFLFGPRVILDDFSGIVDGPVLVCELREPKLVENGSTITRHAESYQMSSWLKAESSSPFSQASLMALSALKRSCMVGLRNLEASSG